MTKDNDCSMLIDGEPYISDMAKTNVKLAVQEDKEKKSKNEFFYWLGYWNGQASLNV